MGAPKTQISPIPPESYGERFVKFISGLTMAKEEQQREARSSEQLDGSISAAGPSNAHQRSSFNVSRKSIDRVVEKAERQARKSEEHGATEDERRDRTLSAKRSPSAERTNGVAGNTLPVVEEDREASSREESLHDEKQSATNGQTNMLEQEATVSAHQRPESKREKSVHGGKATAILESPVIIPSQEDDAKDEPNSFRNQDGDKPPPTPEKDLKYQSLPPRINSLPPFPPLKFVDTPRTASPAQFDSGEFLVHD